MSRELTATKSCTLLLCPLIKCLFWPFFPLLLQLLNNYFILAQPSDDYIVVVKGQMLRVLEGQKTYFEALTPDRIEIEKANLCHCVATTVAPDD